MLQFFGDLHVAKFPLLLCLPKTIHINTYWISCIAPYTVSRCSNLCPIFLLHANSKQVFNMLCVHTGNEMNNKSAAVDIH